MTPTCMSTMSSAVFGRFSSVVMASYFSGRLWADVGSTCLGFGMQCHLPVLAKWTEEGPSRQRLPTPHMGLISISDGTGIGFGQRLTHATASSMDGNSQSQ